MYVLMRLSFPTLPFGNVQLSRNLNCTLNGNFVSMVSRYASGSMYVCM